MENVSMVDQYGNPQEIGLEDKDLTIAIETADELGLDLPITSAVKDIELELINQGYKDDDISVLRRAIRERDQNIINN